MISGGAPPNVPGADWKAVGTGDFNGDGQTDIVWEHTDGRILLWNMSGTTFLNAVRLRNGPSAATGWKIGGAGDFNLDGKTDLLLRHTNGQTRFWFFNDEVFVGSASGRTSAAGARTIAPK